MEEAKDEEEKAALASFRARCDAESVDIPLCMSANGGADGARLRFLRARKLDVDKALVMLRDTLAWRAKHGVDAILDEALDLEDFRAIATMYPASYHGRDVYGRPVYIERTGSAKFTDVLDKLGHEVGPRRRTRVDVRRVNQPSREQ